MPFITEISCPTNGRLLASFSMDCNYYYRLADGTEFPLPVNYAWCYHCEQFVEVERLYSISEIQQHIENLLATKDTWTSDDTKAAKHYAALDRVLPDRFKCQARYETWQAVLAWRHSRKSGPRCLQCGSIFAIKILPTGKEIEHPAGQCTIRVGVGGHFVGSQSESTFFDADGLRLGIEISKQWT